MTKFEDILKNAKQNRQQKLQGEAELVCASTIKAKSKEWLWEGHLLRGALELLSGIPGLGKSQAQIHLVACVTTASKWPDGTAGMKEPANVIMLTAEDTLDQEVIPRLLAAGADLKRIHILKCIKTDVIGRQFLLSEDLDALEKAVTKIGNVALVTIDPITAYMGGKIDSHKTTEVRSQLGPLKDFAERMHVAISAITHPPKSSSQKAIDHFIGSQAFIAAGRIGHVCIKEFDEDDDSETGRILFTLAKHNPSKPMPTLVYRIVEAIIGQDEDTGLPITAPHVVWEKDSVGISADEAVRAAAGNGSKQRGRQEAVQTFLRIILKDGNPVPAKDVYTEAAKHGFTEEQLRTARGKLGVITEQPKGLGGAWTWRLEPF